MLQTVFSGKNRKSKASHCTQKQKNSENGQTADDRLFVMGLGDFDAGAAVKAEGGAAGENSFTVNAFHEGLAVNRPKSGSGSPEASFRVLLVCD